MVNMGNNGDIPEAFRGICHALEAAFKIKWSSKVSLRLVGADKWSKWRVLSRVDEKASFPALK